MRFIQAILHPFGFGAKEHPKSRLTWRHSGEAPFGGQVKYSRLPSPDIRLELFRGFRA
jgi:hypothetical protein